jgi:hypothetical protein
MNEIKENTKKMNEIKKMIEDMKQEFDKDIESLK